MASPAPATHEHPVVDVGPRSAPSSNPSPRGSGARWRLPSPASVGEMYEGRMCGAAATSSARPVTPVSTSRLSRPALWAPSMSVSSRSPITSGRSPPTRRTVSSNSGVSGLPATTGSLPEKLATACTRTPLPGPRPFRVGTVKSVFEANHGSPCLTRIAPSVTVRHDRSGLYPETTATGSSSVEEDRAQPLLGERLDQTGAADHEHRRAGRAPARDQPGRRLGGG